MFSLTGIKVFLKAKVTYPHLHQDFGKRSGEHKFQSLEIPF